MSKWVLKVGRKYALAVIAMALGFVVTVSGMILAMIKPTAATQIADMVASFAMTLSVSIGAFSGANAAISWKHGSQPKTVVRTESQTTVTGSALPTELTEQPNG